MTAAAPAGQRLSRWLAHTLVLGLGGAVLTYGALFAANVVLPLVLGSRIVGSSTANTLIIALAAVLGAIGVVLFIALRTFWSAGRSVGVVLGWWGLFFAFTALGQSMGGLSLAAYGVAWLAIGAVWSLLLSRPEATARPVPRPAAPAGPAPRTGPPRRGAQTERLLPRSEYGRIPPDTVVLMTRHVETAHNAANMLPGHAPRVFNGAATGLVLDHTLRDWWENNNSDGLTAVDGEDLGCFVELAWQQAQQGGSEIEQLAVFRTVLRGLLGDWLSDWNADGVSGPPQWQTARRR